MQTSWSVLFGNQITITQCTDMTCWLLNLQCRPQNESAATFAGKMPNQSTNNTSLTSVPTATRGGSTRRMQSSRPPEALAHRRPQISLQQVAELRTYRCLPFRRQQLSRRSWHAVAGMQRTHAALYGQRRLAECSQTRRAARSQDFNCLSLPNTSCRPL